MVIFCKQNVIKIRMYSAYWKLERPPIVLDMIRTDVVPEVNPGEIVVHYENKLVISS
jgi:hypothetical protein